jgi:hypothetical protein
MLSKEYGSNFNKPRSRSEDRFGVSKRSFVTKKNRRQFKRKDSRVLNLINNARDMVTTEALKEKIPSPRSIIKVVLRGFIN